MPKSTPMPKIKIKPYKLNSLPKGIKRRPFFIGCSGGAGHNAAIEAIIKYLLERNIINLDNLAEYLPTDFGTPESPVQIGSRVSHNVPLLSTTVRWILKKTDLPILPEIKSLLAEIEKLEKNQLDAGGSPKKRFYLDMLLDIYKKPEYAAIWNILQRDEQTAELTKLIKLQSKSDRNNYPAVYNYTIKKLEEAAKNGHPYTEIISTQAMSLPALCDAVEYYNNNIVSKYNNAFSIKIHQYMTDLPTAGATHFFNPLTNLTRNQCEQMYLYGVNLDEKVVSQFNLAEKGFAGLFSIDPEDNPIVRPGFRNEKIKLSKEELEKEIKLKIQVSGKNDEKYTVAKGEEIASIMLGSQAGRDTVEYVKELVQSGRFKKIFVFGGNNPHIKSQIDTLVGENKTDIIPMDNQDDVHASRLLSRSNVIVKRGGGLSMMEEMSSSHIKNQTIFIHCKADKIGKLGSGISWEDGNVDNFIHHMETKNVKVQRTCVETIQKQLKETNKKKFNNYRYTFFEDENEKYGLENIELLGKNKSRINLISTC